MTSVASSGTSPRSGYDPLHGEFLTDDESWAFIDQTGASNAGSVGFFPSPESGSLRSYGIVAHQNQLQPSPPAPSPLQLDQDHIHHHQQHRQQHQQPQIAGHVFAGDAGMFADQHLSQSYRDDGAPIMDHNSFPEHPTLIEQMTIADHLPFLSNIDNLNGHLGTQGIMAGNFIQAPFNDGTNDFVFGDHESIRKYSLMIMGHAEPANL